MIENRVKANKMYVYKKPIQWAEELAKEVNGLRNKRKIKDIELIKDSKTITAVVTFYEYQSED